MAPQEPWLKWQKSKVAPQQVFKPEDQAQKVLQKPPHPPFYEPGNFCTEQLKRLPAPFVCPPGMDLILLLHGHSAEDTAARRAPLQDTIISSTPATAACSGQNPEKLWQRCQTGEMLYYNQKWDFWCLKGITSAPYNTPDQAQVAEWLMKQWIYSAKRREQLVGFNGEKFKTDKRQRIGIWFKKILAQPGPLTSTVLVIYTTADRHNE